MGRPIDLGGDEVQRLLRAILKRAGLVAGAGSMTSCVSALNPADSDRSAERGHERDESASAPRDAGLLSTSAGALGPAVPCSQAVSGGYASPLRANGLKPRQPFDYLAIRRVSGPFLEAPQDAGTEAWTQETFHVLSETGTRCATAPVASDCSEKVARHPREFVRTQCVQVCSELSVVTTRGGIVERWAGPERMVELLGEIDSDDEALLLAEAHGYDVVCGDAKATSVRASDDGYEVFAVRTTELCSPVTTTRYHLRISRQGELGVLGSTVLKRDFQLCIGRKPVGLLSEAIDQGRSRLGDHLARCAHLEAASVLSFERLARELVAHGAPQSLVSAALEARDDEIRHAHTIAALAQTFGGAPVVPQVVELPSRDLAEIALENAVEGCVRETFGALVGGYQAQHAAQPELREAMLTIAEDEARHAALAYDVHRWIMSKLDPAARTRIRHAQQRAVFELAREIQSAPDPFVMRAAGLPTAEMSRFLLQQLSVALWRRHRPLPSAMRG